jgi:hypothetical protein
VNDQYGTNSEETPPDWAFVKADAILALVAEDRRELVEALRNYEREHAKQFKPLDCQCSYCKVARAALAKERNTGKLQRELDDMMAQNDRYLQSCEKDEEAPHD